jgi:hypothetical protein
MVAAKACRTERERWRRSHSCLEQCEGLRNVGADRGVSHCTDNLVSQTIRLQAQ